MGEDTNPDFSLADRQGYMLNRGYAAASRLNLQFYLWKNALGFNLHPSVSIAADSAIADVATGTGLWLLEMARDYPDAQLDGFDNDIEQTPNKRWLPRNVTFSYWDIFEELPDHLVGKYDLVHVRMVMIVIQGDPRPVFRNLFKMLKPGGVLQWDDIDCVDMHVKYTDSCLSAPGLEQLQDVIRAGGRHDWLLDLPRLLLDDGFESTSLYKFGNPDELVRAFCDQHLLTVEEFAASLQRIGKTQEAKRIYKLISQAYQESVQGAAMCNPRFVCIAHKPTSAGASV